MKAFPQILALCAIGYCLPAFGQGGPLVVSDTFDRANGALGSANTGQVWAQHHGSTAIDNGALRFGYGFDLASLDSGESTGAVEVRVPTLANEFWIVFRFSNDSNYWRFGRWQGGPYQLQQVVGGSLGTPSLSVSASINPQVGDLIRCSLLSPGINCSVNATSVVSTSDGFNAGATRVGVSGYIASSAQFDDFRVFGPVPGFDLTARIIGPSSATAGGTAVWTATVQNIGTASSPAAELRIMPPSAQPALTIENLSCTFDGAQYRCPILSLSAQASVSATIRLSPVPLTPSLTVALSIPPPSGEIDTSQNSAASTISVRPAIPSGALLVDTFDRPDSPTLGTANTGQTWTQHFQPFSLRTGIAFAPAGFALSSLDTGSAVNRTTIILNKPGPEFWMLVRFEHSATYWRFGRRQQGSYQIQQVVNNEIASPAVTTLATATPAPGDVLICDNTSSQVECSVNGVAVVRASTSAGNTATRVGISSYQGDVALFDDLVITGPPPLPDLAVTVSGPTSANAGVLSSWTATVRNISVLPATSVELNISATSIGPPTFTGASCTAAGGGWRCPVGNLTAGQQATVRLDAIPPAAGTVVFSASAPAISGETAVSNNSANMSTAVRQPIPAGAVVADTFDRADANQLGVATSGHPWMDHSGNVLLRNNMAAPADGFVLASLDSGISVYSAHVTLAVPDNEFWLILRLLDGQNYWRFGRRSGQPYQMQLIVGGALVSPQMQTLASVMPAPGDLMKCNVAGAGITCSINGVDVVTTADSTGQARTRVGLSAYVSSNARFDDLYLLGPSGPNVAITAATPRYIAQGQNFPLDVTSKNVGVGASGSGTLIVSLPSTVTIVTRPAECLPQGANLHCELPGLAPSAVKQFPFSLRTADTLPLSGSATATVSGDTFPIDDSASWTNSVLPAGSVIDGFDRSNTGSGLGVSPSLHTWNTPLVGFRILSGTAQADASGALAFVNTSFSYGTMEVVLGDQAATTAILFRVVNGTNYFRLAADASGYYALRKVVDGVVQNLQFSLTRESIRPLAGDVVRIVTRPDDGVFVTVNGTHILDAGDQVAMHATGWGLASVGGPASAGDFFVSPRLEGLATVDNFVLPDQWPLGAPNVGVKYRWHEWLGPAWVTISGQAKPSSSQYTYTWIDASSEQPKVEVKVAAQGQGAWLVFRFDEFNNRYFRFGQTGGIYRVEFVEDASPLAMPVPIQTLATPAPQNGDILRVYQRPDGFVECSVNGIVTHRFTDPSTNIRSTANGLASLGSSAGFDDFKVTPYGQ